MIPTATPALVAIFAIVALSKPIFAHSSIAALRIRARVSSDRAYFPRASGELVLFLLGISGCLGCFFIEECHGIELTAILQFILSFATCEEEIWEKHVARY